MPALPEMEGVRRGELKQFTLWETKTVGSIKTNPDRQGGRFTHAASSPQRFYLVAANVSQTRFRILKVDRSPPVPVEHAGADGDEARGAKSDSRKEAKRRSVEVNTGAAYMKDKKQAENPERAASTRGHSGWNMDFLIPTAAAGSGSTGGASAYYSAGAPTGSDRYVSADISDMARLQQATDAALRPNSKAGASVISSLTSPADALKEGPGHPNGVNSATGHPGGSSWSSTASRILQTSNFFNAAMPNVSEAPDLAATVPPAEKGTASNQQPKKKEEATYSWELNVTSDRVVYTRSQIQELLQILREGNRASGGLREVGRFFGLVGFIRFTSTYYMVLISRRSVVALIGGHYIYHVEETKILPVCHPAVLAGLGGRSKALEQQEAQLLHTFGQVDLSKNFYFSYTYNLTQTLQDNLTDPDPSSRPKPTALSDPATSPISTARKSTTAWGYEEKFVWNYHLLMPAFGACAQLSADEALSHGREWVLPLVYGFVDQAKLSVLARTVHVTLIARRSRHFAGARFLKRGANESGQVANDVETEQIVCEASTTPFYAPAPRTTGHWRKSSHSTAGENAGEDVHDNSEEVPEEGDASQYFTSSPTFTSYVMHRGSIPIFWTQDSTNLAPRPPIELSVVDPFFTPAAQHFDAMFARYGTPVILLNLIKTNEKQPREGKLGVAFAECVEYLNQFLPPAKRMRYIAWDMSRASKTHGQDVIGILEDIAEETIEATKFFHSGPEKRSALAGSHFDGYDGNSDPRRSTILLQSGVARTNCVDCLDRTNAAQFVIGKAAFGHQLHALGLLDTPTAPFDCDAVNMLTEMYHDLGDTIALQYGGSHLVNTMETYRKINQWCELSKSGHSSTEAHTSHSSSTASHSRDMLEGLKRYYSNSFVDADKQMAINLFLGVHSHSSLSTQTDVSGDEENSSSKSSRVHYQQWYNPEHLEPRGSLEERQLRLHQVANVESSFWMEYYRPRLFTDLRRLHAFSMTAVHQNPHSLISQHGNGSEGPTSFGSSAQLSHGSVERYSEAEATSIVIPSPFEVRQSHVHEAVVHTAPHSAHQRHRSGSSSVSIKSGSGGSSKAIIGGVRRWMSINRSPSNHTKHGRDAHARSHRDETGSQPHGSADTDPVVAPSRAALVSLVEKLTCPRVSADEEAEYVSYSRQFAYEDRDDADDGLRMALTSASAGAWASSTEGVAQSDIDMYRAGAELIAGYGSRVQPLLHAIGSGGSTDSELANAFAGVQQLVTQGVSMLATGKRTARDEAKARAYAAWLGVPVQ